MSKLMDFSRNEFSQFGEDGILEKIFEIVPNQNKTCIEFGAWDGKKYSNTHYLIATKQWTGVLIEANSKRFVDLQNTYKNNERVHMINSYVDFEGKDSLDNLLKQTAIAQDFDLLSIDIDGNDYHIWDSVVCYKPKVVVIEFNPTIPNDIDFIQEKNMNICQGSSLLSLVKLAKTKGYELVATTVCNAFFVSVEFFDLFNIADNSLNAIHSVPIAPRIYQLFDGTLVLTDNFKLLWRPEVKITSNDLQVLPKFARFFTDTHVLKIRRALTTLYISLRFRKNRTLRNVFDYTKFN
jgi:hypothetical protein